MILRNGPPALRKAYLRLLIERIELDDDEVRMTGPIGQLERALEAKDSQAMPMVPSFVREWRPGRDSNP
jgi:site-specific DNA recombinase